MLELLGYIVLTLSIIGSIVVVIEIQSYFIAFICFWIGVTIASILILEFKQD